MYFQLLGQTRRETKQDPDIYSYKSWRAICNHRGFWEQNSRYTNLRDIVEVDISKAVEEVIPSNKTNIFIASFTTSWARLELYKYLELLKDQVLYFDTDSIIYLWREGFSDVETGPFLRQMKDETAGVPIHEFVTGGPKNYSYMLQNGDTECKIRGFTMDEQGSALLNFDSMKRHIIAEIKNPRDEPQTIAVPVSIKGAMSAGEHAL